MPIVESTAVWGEHEIRTGLPDRTVVTDALVVPQRGPPDHDAYWGVYDRDGRLVEDAALTRGPGRILVGQSETIDGVSATCRFEGDYIYGGSMHGHYGHYLLEFLPRYWTILNEGLAGRKILIHIMPGHTNWIDLPFVKRTLESLGLEYQDFIAITETTLVENLVVPAPSFIIQKKAHKIFSTLCATIGNILGSEATEDSTDEPVFLSKEQLSGGVWNIRNEDEFVHELRKADIRIVHPEQLSLGEQVALFKRHKTIGGIMGSALHTTVFCNSSKKIVAFGHNGFIHSDFLLIDKIKDNQTKFYHAPEDLVRCDAVENFSSTFAFKDPKMTGRAFAEILLKK